MLRILLILSCVAHLICGFSDCLLSYGKNGRLNLKEIKNPEKMSKMFADMPLWQPMASILIGTFAITVFTFGYLALSSWMYKFSEPLSYTMLTSSIFFSVSIVVHHVICGLVEWFYIKLGRTDEARTLVLEFQKKTIITMVIGYFGLLIFVICLFIAVVTGKTDLPVWTCVFNTLVIMLLLSPTKLPAKGNIAGAIMYLGLAVVI